MSTSVMIRRLALVQHVLFLVLVVIGTVRGLGTGAPAAPLLLSAALLLLWYAVGARSAARVRSAPGGGVATGRRAGTGGWTATGGGAPGGTGALGRGGWWLLGLVACWLLTVAVTPDMVWVAFSLWLLAGHLLPRAAAVGLALAVLAVVLVRGGRAEDWSVAALVGPTVGAVFALALSRGLRLVVRDSIEREGLVAQLVAAQAETEELHAELAQTQRAAGVVAERTRLSRDIHDTLAQGFSSILLLARAGGATDDTSAHRRLLEQIETSAAEHLDEARRVVGALAPAPLESGLAEALRRIADRFGEETGVDAEVRVEGDLAALPPVLEVALLRVGQAALANVRLHARAGRVVLTLAETDDSVRLDVVDDGVGFDPTAIPAGPPLRGGYGLRASRERLRELGGGLDVESEPGSGTAVSAYLPLPGADARAVDGGGR